MEVATREAHDDVPLAVRRGGDRNGARARDGVSPTPRSQTRAVTSPGAVHTDDLDVRPPREARMRLEQRAERGRSSGSPIDDRVRIADGDAVSSMPGDARAPRREPPHLLLDVAAVEHTRTDARPDPDADLRRPSGRRASARRCGCRCRTSRRSSRRGSRSRPRLVAVARATSMIPSAPRRPRRAALRRHPARPTR